MVEKVEFWLDLGWGWTYKVYLEFGDTEAVGEFDTLDEAMKDFAEKWGYSSDV